MKLTRSLLLLPLAGVCLMSASCFAADAPTALPVPATPSSTATAPKADELAAKWYDATGTLIEALSSAAQLEKGRHEEPQRQIAALLSEGVRTPGFTARFAADLPRALQQYGALSLNAVQEREANAEMSRQLSLYVALQNDVLIEQNRQIIALLTQIAAKGK